MDLVRIIPNESDGGLVKTQGTQVFCGEQEIHGVKSATVHFEVDDVVRADLKLLGWMAPVDAIPRFQMRHPYTGEIVTLKKLVLEGGEEINLSPEADITNLSSRAREFVRRAREFVRSVPNADGGEKATTDEPDNQNQQ